MSTDPSCIAAVDHIGIRVGDVDRALALFVDGLGFAQTFRGVGPDGRTEVAFVTLGAVQFELVQHGTGDVAVLDHIGLRTSGSLGEAAERLARAGIATEGDELDGSRDSRAIRLDPSTTIGLNMHVSRYQA